MKNKTNDTINEIYKPLIEESSEGKERLEWVFQYGFLLNCMYIEFWFVYVIQIWENF